MIVATRGEIFSLKFTKYRFSGRAPSLPAGGALPKPPIRNKGAYFSGDERGWKGRGEEGRVWQLGGVQGEGRGG